MFKRKALFLGVVLIILLVVSRTGTGQSVRGEGSVAGVVTDDNGIRFTRPW